jgi:hypothetical protein
MSRANIPAVILAAFSQAACLVQITRVADAGPMFEQARREAMRYQGRPGPAREINVLVYERDEGKLVRVSVPMWVVRTAERHVDWKREFDHDDDEVARRVRRHVRLEDLEKAGLGVLVEVEEDEGEKVLVWLR